MALTAHVFPQFQYAMSQKMIDLDSDTLKVALSNNATTQGLSTSGISTAKKLSDWKALTGNSEISGTGYTAGGATLSGVSVSLGSTNNTIFTLTCSSPSWSTATFSANQAVFYSSTAEGTIAYSLICFWDFGGSQSVTAGTFTLTINASGLVTWTCS